jgi:hypothetical protein
MKEKPVHHTMLKKEDWGLLTITSLLATFIFPPYFIHLMAMAALTEFAHLWTTRLSRLDQERFVEFEKEFRKGYKLEKAGQTGQALKWYRTLEKRYSDLPQANKLAILQIRNITRGKHPPEKKPATPPDKEA